MYGALRTVLFRLEPEQAHHLVLSLMRLAGALPPARWLLRRIFWTPSKPVQLFGLTFPNPVGLAAGYDKDGTGWRGLACLGFGHIEVGTVTLRSQPGNLHPRLFRLPEDRALINRMGFPGRGADFVARQISGGRPAGLVLGVNIGKNKDTPLERAAEDYHALLVRFAPLADYLAVNVSSPNTEGLRRLQAREALGELLKILADERIRLAAHLGRNVPLLVKLAPDLSHEELDDALDSIQMTGMDGVIATNTTLERGGLHSARAVEVGGLSGAPLAERSTALIAEIQRRTGGKLPIIGVGGIMDAAGAQVKLAAGASLVQVYTGLVYHGPGLVRQVIKGLQSTRI